MAYTSQSHCIVNSLLAFLVYKLKPVFGSLNPSCSKIIFHFLNTHTNSGNVVTFFVDVWDSDKLSYAGPGILELNETEIIVWKQDKQGQVVVWQLRHIRMFKAKQDHFQVMTGR